MKRAIVIGATSGIGKELAKKLASDNYIVGITGRREDNLTQVKKTNPDRFICKSFDCTKGQNALNLNELTEELEGLDLLVLCSGVGDLNENLDYEIEQKTINLNVRAFTEIVDWSFHYFSNQGYGHIVAISSLAGIRGSRLAPAYYASKAYQINYLEGIRQKVFKIKKPIFITDARPGYVDTEIPKEEGEFWIASAEKAASQILNLIKRKKGIGYITRRWILIAIALKLIPSWIYKRI